jgi:hypothetical protein
MRWWPPPLHAPLQFANVAASSVLHEEYIDLPGGCARVEAQAWQGDGWLECQFEQQPQGYQLRALFRCLALDTDQVQEYRCSWQLQ